MDWAYGIITVESRRHTTFPPTLESLRNGGFNNPTLFVDGPATDHYNFLELRVVQRGRTIGVFGNWLLALMELWIVNPNADRYAIFEDDLLVNRNLKQYLENYDLPDNQYLNLFTFPQNEELNKEGYTGWYESNQKGRGALGLVFSNRCTFDILTSPIMVAWPKTGSKKNIDGRVLTAMERIGTKEMVHYPSLAFHLGEVSTLQVNGINKYPNPKSFKGEEFNALEFENICLKN